MATEFEIGIQINDISLNSLRYIQPGGGDDFHGSPTLVRSTIAIDDAGAPDYVSITLFCVFKEAVPDFTEFQFGPKQVNIHALTRFAPLTGFRLTLPQDERIARKETTIQG